jgi:hypothetical protein
MAANRASASSATRPSLWWARIRQKMSWSTSPRSTEEASHTTQIWVASIVDVSPASIWSSLAKIAPRMSSQVNLIALASMLCKPTSMALIWTHILAQTEYVHKLHNVGTKWWQMGLLGTERARTVPRAPWLTPDQASMWKLNSYQTQATSLCTRSRPRSPKLAGRWRWKPVAESNWQESLMT